MSEYTKNMEFEAEVRRVAEAVWNLERGSCQPKHYSNQKDLTELDGYAETRETIHLIMVTTSSKLEKIKADVKKLGIAERNEKNPMKSAKKWIITSKQLDAQHIKHANENGVNVRTLEQFRGIFFDSHEYLSRRGDAAFGSARNLSNGSIDISNEKYIESPLILEVIESSGRVARSGYVDYGRVLDIIKAGSIVVAIAPFGSGKSMLLNHMYKDLEKLVSKSGGKTPIAINLREHWGQDYADEILERHARLIGIKEKEDVNIAWRSGMAHLLIDGFDETAGQIVAKVNDANFMREARGKALAGVRSILGGYSGETGVLITGRDHYFDNYDEMAHSLGISDKKIHVVIIEEFNDEQAKRYLHSRGIDAELPSWLPRKPLLLGYLAHNKLLEQVLKIEPSKGFGYAWDNFLSLICRREAAHERSVMEADTIRSILERLAIDVKNTISGTGPISGKDISDAYIREVGSVADEGVVMQLQRLPGLTQRDQDRSARSFVDGDMLSALQGSRMAKFITGEVNDIDSTSWKSGISKAAVETCIHIMQDRFGITARDAVENVFASIISVKRDIRKSQQYQLMCDIVIVLNTLGYSENRQKNMENMNIESAVIETLDLEGNILSNISFSDCIIKELRLELSELHGITFDNCTIEKIIGISERNLSESGIFKNCDVSYFEEMGSNAAILRSSLDKKLKALATVLRKLFLQAGAGRKENAFFRGIDGSEMRGDVEKILEYLINRGYAYRHNEVIHPNREFGYRMRNILDNIQNKDDEIIQDVLDL